MGAAFPELPYSPKAISASIHGRKKVMRLSTSSCVETPNLAKPFRCSKRRLIPAASSSAHISAALSKTLRFAELEGGDGDPVSAFSFQLRRVRLVELTARMARSGGIF